MVVGFLKDKGVLLWELWFVLVFAKRIIRYFNAFVGSRLLVVVFGKEVVEVLWSLFVFTSDFIGQKLFGELTLSNSHLKFAMISLIIALKAAPQIQSLGVHSMSFVVPLLEKGQKVVPSYGTKSQVVTILT